MAHKKLITAEEIIELAFIDQELETANIKDMFIEIAQEEHILPVLGDEIDPDDSLYQEIVDQNDTNPSTLTAVNKTLLEDFLKPALAFYVKYEIVEDMAINMVSQGLQENFTEFGRAVSSAQRSDLSKRVFSHATTLKDKMVRFLENNKDDYPKYATHKNVSKRSGKIIGGIFLGSHVHHNAHHLHDCECPECHENRPIW